MFQKDNCDQINKIVQIVKVDSPRFVFENLAFVLSTWAECFRTDVSVPRPFHSTSQAFPSIALK
jgi:hypothetical protein